jgi:hypothetical protein
VTTTIGVAALNMAALIEAAVVDRTNTALYQVQFTFGTPDQWEEQQAVVFLGVSGLDELARVLGPQPNVRDENFGLDFGIYCEIPEGTAKDAWARGWAIYGGLRDIPLTNPRLAVGSPAVPIAGLQWALPTPKDSTGVVRPLATDGKGRPGWTIRIDMTVVCKARS